jgi:hypothetical protein
MLCRKGCGRSMGRGLATHEQYCVGGTASKAMEMPAKSHHRKKELWTLTLVKGERQLAATVSDVMVTKLIKEILY